MENRSVLWTVVKCMLVLVLGVGAAGCLCYADTTDRSCPKGELKTDEGCIKSPTLLRKVQPEYPRQARRAREEGHVTLEVRVMEDGSVGDIEVKKCTNPGHGFEDAAMDALKKWRYEAVTLHGKPAQISFTVTIDFMLQ